MSLGALPDELQCAIFRLLDPIGLISVSQASAHFRRLVSPGRVHFIERLLALECVPEHGGGGPVLQRGRRGIEPRWVEPRWDRMRWACTSCVKLLPHTSFHNLHLLRLAYRKPEAGSPAANLVTSWDAWPLPRTGERRRLGRGHKHKDPAAARQRQQYNLAVTYGRGTHLSNWPWHGAPPHSLRELQAYGLEGFVGMAEATYDALTPPERRAIFYDVARGIEQTRCGFHRRLRACNECRFRSGELGRLMPRRSGTDRVPILASRQLSFYSCLDRCFPRFDDALKSKRPPGVLPTRVKYGVGAYPQLWTMYMVRCQHCAEWREMRAFRFGGLFPSWKPCHGEGDERHAPDRYVCDNWDGRLVTRSLVNELACNACMARLHGRQQLSIDLQRWFERLVRQETALQEAHMERGWDLLRRSQLHEIPFMRKPEVKKLSMNTERKRGRKAADLTEDEVGVWLTCFRRFVDIWQQHDVDKESEGASLANDHWFTYWLDHFEDAAVHWRWLRACRAEISKTPEVLVDWALGRDDIALG